MGTFTDSLLKLTEFPFSYSFLSLLILISTPIPAESPVNPSNSTDTPQPPVQQPSNSTDNEPGLFSDEFLQRLGPQLILMGFFATTLSIVDPIGYLQKSLLLGWFSLMHQPLSLHLAQPRSNAASWFSRLRLIKWLFRIDRIEWLINWNKTAPSILTINIFNFDLFGHHVMDQIKPWVVICLLENFQDVLKSISEGYKKQQQKNPEHALESSKWLVYDLLLNEVSSYREKVKKREEEENKKRKQLDPFNAYLKESEESEFANEQKENQRKENDPIYKLYNTLQQLKYRTSTTTWLSREIDKNTGLWYFVIVLSTFVIAQFVITVQGVINQGIDVLDFRKKLPIGEQSYIILSVISVGALAVVLIMLYFRYKGLRSMALVTFKFLAEQAAIKIDKASFDKTLEEIRQYLNEGDWTLAGIWATRLMDEYNDHIKEKVQNGEISEPENVENNKVNYRDFGIY